MIRIISFIALIAALVYLAIYAVKFYERKKQTATFDDQIKQTESLSDQELADLWANVKATYPDVDFPEGMQVKFSHLYAINRDFVGWLQIDNTNIRTPLLQKKDDNSFYLYHDIYKKSSRYGNPYIHYKCDMGPDGPSRNTIVYGHNTHDGLMFHQLTNYMTREGYLKAPIITMDTLYETTRWKVFAVMLTNATPDGDNGYVFDYLYPEFSSDGAFMDKIKEIQARSMIHTGVDVAPTDKIITLYTCYQNIFKGGRLVILGRLLRPGESEEINAANVYYDENAHFPQAYYRNGGSANTADENTVVVTAAPETAAPTTAAPVTAAQTTLSPAVDGEAEPAAEPEPEPAAEAGYGGDEEKDCHRRRLLPLYPRLEELLLKTPAGLFVAEREDHLERILQVALPLPAGAVARYAAEADEALVLGQSAKLRDALLEGGDPVEALLDDLQPLKAHLDTRDVERGEHRVVRRGRVPVAQKFVKIVREFLVGTVVLEAEAAA